MRIGDEIKIIRAVKRTLRKRKRFEIAALKTAERLIKTRIHTKGQATDNSQIGKYSSGWRKVRQKKGRQVGYVDLSFQGNLIKNYTLGTNNGNPVFGFLTDEQRLIMTYQESYRKKDIVTPNESELKEMDKAYQSEFDFVFQKEINATGT